VDDLHTRVTLVESEIENLKRRDDMLENGIRELRQELHDTRSEIGQKMDDVKGQLSEVVKTALSSMPEWAARSLANSKSLTAVLVTLLSVAVSALLWFIFRHGG